MAKRATDHLIADRYALQRTLGRGGMGVVWRARDTLLDRDVALKEVQLPPALNAEEREAMRARVLREARAAARLNHPNVVTLYDVVREEGRTFIVMELVEAPTLAAVVRERGPLPPAEVAAIGLQLLDALRAAHRVGIVHRDVKPGNVMVPSGEGRAKLADFGIASLAGDPQLTSTGLVLGSPAYMAPEQANGQPSGPATDLWALGATLYLAVEGEPPFERGAAVPTLTAVVNDPPRPMRRGGPLEPVVLSLLAKAPAERPSAGQLRPQLERIARQGASTATATLPLPAPAEQRQPTEQLPAVPPPLPAAAPTAPAPAGADQAAAPHEEDEPTAADVAATAAEPAADAPATQAQAQAQAPAEPEQAEPERAEPERAQPEQAQPEQAHTEQAHTEQAQTEAAEVGEAEPAAAQAAEVDQAEAAARQAEDQAAPAPAGPVRPAPQWQPPRRPPVLPTPAPVVRRQRARGPLLILLAVALVGVALVLAATLRGEDGRGGASPPATGGAMATTRQQGGGQGNSAGQGTTTTAGQPGVPAGFQRYSNPQRGYAVAYPSGWKVDEKRGKFNTTVFSDRSSGRSFEILSSKPPTPDLAAASDRWEQTVSSRKGFHLIRQDQVTYHGRPAVVTEYTFRGKGGTVHERHVNVDFGTWGYAVVEDASEGDWAAADRDVWRAVEMSLHESHH
jgi:hypothetical protein